MGRLSRLSGWTQCRHKSLSKREAGLQSQTRSSDGDGEGRDDAVTLQKRTKSQGTQVTSKEMDPDLLQKERSPADPRM